ncbi:WD40-repeat-containing domain protein [Mucor mucedo]|uniref:WD40-repeat-containing domain protein n=1 Tax=Mucor mucedo TaxID=29922 RepID=UPI002221029B|nr:WD40-repeat-containing domain protein [Mucor mucedo]KAI7892799.1 WD40-repeat-containing domain protein [Mucor mucedo]
MTETSSVFGLRHQARCLTAVTSSIEKSKFLAGTVGAKDNAIYLLEYNDDTMAITPTLYNHPEEIWDIVSCPTDENLLFTSHSPVSGNPLKRKATLWRKPGLDSEGKEDNDQRHDLTCMVTLENEGVKKVLWNPQEQSQEIISIDSNKIYLSSLDDTSTAQTSLVIDVSSTFSKESDAPSLRQLQNAVWNPHGAELITVGDCNLSGWDLRSGKNSFNRCQAHKSTIRAVDYNPNKPYHVVTGGDDAKVYIWDIRQLKEPILDVGQEEDSHSHWIWSVAFNSLQDQLLLTSSSDNLVNLHNVVSVSAASYLDSSSEDEKDVQSDDYGRSTNKPTDGLIYTYDQHEDSVYKVAWSPADTWTFASISYAGRVVISQVPTNEKFKILGV